MGFKLVVFDLDGTLVNGEGIVSLAEKAGVRQEVEEVTDLTMKGEIDFGDALRRRVALLEGLTRDEVEDALCSLEMSPGAQDVCRKIDCEIAIFSGGFLPLARKVGDEIGADYIRANELVEKDGVLTGDVKGDLVDNDKGEVLRQLASDIGIEHDEIIAVGDGSNDVPMFDVAGFSIGFDAKPVARKAASVNVDRRDMRLIEPYLKQKKVIRNGRVN
ncbi:MAG: phosphoserine phosphatase SerB [Halobacteria archaeon]|nr:phosphoserine phosphatase SerB [Halobacteria archaeon]